ncbi:MAG TPA: DUF72 domain-containing protein [Fimbriimonadaceae bacterium]|nr:DUF72 domain-containing protein [Fimbriimonadaceae bacterium]
MARAYIGTSGWAYKHWKQSWYGGLPPSRWLAHSAERFTGLEANGTFYRLQSRESFEAWAAQVPEDFRFTIKAHRFLTHRKRLLEIGEGIRKQKEPAAGLGEKLACVLWQLPAQFHLNLERLQGFLEELGEWPETRHAIEFRHTSWFNAEVSALLSRHRVANCISDAAAFPRWDVVTTDFVYVRLHGKPHTYCSAYSEVELDEWAARCCSWLGAGHDVHVYFDNDANGHAPWDALGLLGRVNRDGLRSAA